MAQNHPPAPAKRTRGRPRAYQPEVALARALDAFWEGGYSGTSLDQLAAATGMNRPSLYAAFGDKQALYLKALQAYSEASGRMIRGAFEADQPVSKALMQVYAGAIERYVGGEKAQRGCFSVGTAAVEAASNPVVRAAFAENLRSLDAAFCRRFERAISDRELPRSADSKMLGRMASAVIHTLAIRARGGESKASLLAIARGAVEMICGTR